MSGTTSYKGVKNYDQILTLRCLWKISSGALNFSSRSCAVLDIHKLVAFLLKFVLSLWLFVVSTNK